MTFRLSVLEIHKSSGLDDIGSIRWSIAMCLLTVFVVVYFSLWRGIKSSGKVSGAKGGTHGDSGGPWCRQFGDGYENNGVVN